MSKQISDLRVVATSALVSVSDVVLNIVIAIVTGSTVMLSQALQGVSDLVTGAILFFGVKRSRRSADVNFQFGYGREVFFWVLVAGIVMFVGTGGISLYLGYKQFVNPSQLVFGITFRGIVSVTVAILAVEGLLLWLSNRRRDFL